MKKYFLHNGTTHEGPFDIEELKGITGDTPVWFDGLDDWTTADKVAELKDLIKAAPQIKKPAISKAFIVVALLVIVGALIIIISRPKPEQEIKVKATTPKPIVVITSTDFSKTGVLKLKATIYTTILNQGADGNILVTFHIQQKGHDYSKAKSIFLKSNESQKLEMVFDQMKILEGDVSYNVDCRAEK